MKLIITCFLLLTTTIAYADHRDLHIPVSSVVVVHGYPAKSESILDEVFSPYAMAKGTGFFFDETHIITSYHVVDDAAHIKVKLMGDDRLHPATLLGFDRLVDIAVLELKDDIIGRPAPWQKKTHVSIGETVYTMDTVLCQ